MPRVIVKVRAGARREAVEKVREGYYRAAVKAPAKGGRANEALVKLLAKYFKVPVSKVCIVFGKTSKEKMVQVGK